MNWLKSRRFLGLALVGLALVGLGLKRILTRPLPPLEVALWYWHQPFRLSSGEVGQLQQLGVRQLFVRAGTFRRVGQGVRLTLPQQWASRADGIAIQLVFNFGYDAVHNFAQLPNATLAPAIYEAEQQARRGATQAGLQVVGLQLDLDCPTRLLPKYADLLRQLRQLRAATPAALSITALPTWFTSQQIGGVLAAIDFVAPQYYEADTPKQLSRFTPISNVSKMARGLKAAGQWGTPFYAGLAAYGHALVYDAHGQLLGTYHDLGVREAAHQPALRLARSYATDRHGQKATPDTYVGEDICEFVTTQPMSHDRNAAYHILYDLPTPVMLAQHLALLRAERPANCRGVILFRYPEHSEAQTLPLAAVAATLHGQPAQPNLRVTLTSANAPWELIEDPHAVARPPLDLTVAVTNTGTANVFTASDSVTLTLCFAQVGLDAIAPHDFDGVETFWQAQPSKGATSGSRLRASASRANVVTARKFQLLAGETAKLGPIRIRADGPGSVWGSWSVRGVGGFDLLQGTIPETKLRPVK